MTIDQINVVETLEKAKKQIEEDKSLSPSLRSTIDLLMLIITLLISRMKINSKNSHKAPSQDPNRKKEFKEPTQEIKKPGGQLGHQGKTLMKIDNPHEVIEILVEKKSLPAGDYHFVGFETRQVFDVKISAHVTEYRAEVLENEKGKRYVANFPEGVGKSVQYGNEIKVQSVYMSFFQLIPIARVADYFKGQTGIAVSKGSVTNFNREAFNKLQGFEDWAKNKLLESRFNHADETGINVNGKKAWIHTLCNSEVTLYHADAKRGKDAMDRMGVLPFYEGILCHDHWKSYYMYKCKHALCNAHHLRELTFAFEEDKQEWAKKLYDLLLEINKESKESGTGILSKKQLIDYEKNYRAILLKGREECPLTPKQEKKKGVPKKSKSRNLLERLLAFQEDTLRFMKEDFVSFTNNQGENDLRMTKVQQKISGCFRTIEGAEIFCRVRGYLVTCRKNGIPPSEALRLLFLGKLPEFMTS